MKVVEMWMLEPGGDPCHLPLAAGSVRAGFPSPAEDFAVKRVDLNEELIKHPQATFLIRVAGDSMRQAGIDHDDILVVDRAIKPQSGYGDMSDRFMTLAAGLGPAQEIYSIDECFIDLKGVRGDLVARSHAVRDRIWQWIGIPTCIGIGPTKTLAKLANHIAKDAERKPGSYAALGQHR